MLKRKRLGTSLAAALLVTGLAACGGTGAGESPDGDEQTAGSGGALRVGALPASIDPVATTQRVVGLVAGSVCEGLFENKADLSPSEGLLESWEYDEDLTYTFKLRDGVNFHDGSVLTSADVVASLERYAASAPGATFGELMDSVVADGDLQVTLTLTTPSAAIPALLATPDSAAYIMPASIVADRDPSDALQQLTCTGPYKMDSYVPDQTVELSRFDDYTARSEASDGATGEKVAIVDTITFVPNDASNALNMLRTGELDIQSQFPLDQVGSVEDDDALEAAVIPNGSYPLLQFNTQEGPLSNQTLRQAVLAAIDSEQVMAAAAPSADYYTLDSSLMPPTSPWHSTEGSELYNQADVERSKELQAEAGYGDEELRLLYQSNDAFAPVVIEQIKAAGFNLKAEMVDAATYTQRRADPEQWEMFISGGTSYGDPLTVVFMNSGFPGWWDTPEKQEAMDTFLAAPTQEGRKAAWDTLQGLIYEQVPFIRFGGRAQIDVLASRVADYPLFAGSARGFYNVSLGE